MPKNKGKGTQETTLTGQPFNASPIHPGNIRCVLAMLDELRAFDHTAGSDLRRKDFGRRHLIYSQLHKGKDNRNARILRLAVKRLLRAAEKAAS